MTARLEIWGVAGIPEVVAGDDLAKLVAAHAPDLADGDIVVVTSKIVSKSEGRVVAGDDREAAIDAETVRLVARRGATRIVETRHGFVMAAAGVDASNVARGTVALLPVDPDASAARLRDGLRELLRIDVGVLVTDTMGRPWRNGLVDVAIGAAGVVVLDDHRGRVDEHGHTLEMTVTALADEIAAAAELVKGKLDRVPVAVVRGRGHYVTSAAGRAADLVRRPDDDLFRWGSREAVQNAVAVRPPPRSSSLIEAAIEAVGEEPVVVVRQGDRLLVCVPADAAPAGLVDAGRVAERLRLWLGAEGITAEVAPPDRAGAEPPNGLVAVASIALVH